MLPPNHVWVFMGGGVAPSGAFTRLDAATRWIRTHKLTGMLTAIPLDQGFLDWAMENNATAMKSEKVSAKMTDPAFIAKFTSAAIDHYHFDGGNCGELPDA